MLGYHASLPIGLLLAVPSTDEDFGDGRVFASPHTGYVVTHGGGSPDMYEVGYPKTPTTRLSTTFASQISTLRNAIAPKSRNIFLLHFSR